MATTTTAFTPEPQLFPFIGFPEPAREFTNQPRAEVLYTVRDGVVPAATGGNDSFVTVTCTLPPNFSYVLVESFVGVAQADGANTSNWSKFAVANLADGDSNTRTYRLKLRYDGEYTNEGMQNISAQAVYNLCNIPKVIILPRESTNASLVFQVGTDSVDAGAAQLNFFARFLRYDINQAHHVEVNNPALTR